MKPRSFQRALFLATIGTAFGVSAPGSVLAEYRCDHPQRFDDRRACEYAQQGPAALRRFIERTQSIFGLDFYDYVRPESTASADSGAADRAGAPSDGEPAKRADLGAGLRS